jgi:hypothetical protein
MWSQDQDRLPHLRATGITAYLGTLDKRPAHGGARKPAHHEALDCTDEITLDEVERIDCRVAPEEVSHYHYRVNTKTYSGGSGEKGVICFLGRSLK